MGHRFESGDEIGVALPTRVAIFEPRRRAKPKKTGSRLDSAAKLLLSGRTRHPPSVCVCWYSLIIVALMQLGK